MRPPASRPNRCCSWCARCPFRGSTPSPGHSQCWHRWGREPCPSAKPCLGREAESKTAEELWRQQPSALRISSARLLVELASYSGSCGRAALPADHLLNFLPSDPHPCPTFCPAPGSQFGASRDPLTGLPAAEAIAGVFG